MTTRTNALVSISLDTQNDLFPLYMSPIYLFNFFPTHFTASLSLSLSLSLTLRAHKESHTWNYGVNTLIFLLIGHLQ